jgi:hypothetical protein
MAREFILKGAHVMASYRKVVGEVDGACAHRWRGQLACVAKFLLRLQSNAPQIFDAVFHLREPDRR